MYVCVCIDVCVCTDVCSLYLQRSRMYVYVTLALLPAESHSLASLMSVPGEVLAGARRTCEGQHAPIECNETRRQRPYISSDGSIGLGLTVRAGMEA